MPMPVQIFIKYFWFFAALIGIINFIIIRGNALKEIKKNPEKEVYYKKLIKILVHVLITPYFMLGLLQLAGGFNNFFYVFVGSRHNIFVLLSWLVILFYLILIIYWIVIKDGAKVIIEMKSIFRTSLSLDEKSIKILVSIVAAFLFLVFIAAFFYLPYAQFKGYFC